MKIRIIWTGKTKERYINEGINHYLKLLGPAARVSIIEVKEEKGREKEKMLAAEGKRILKQAQSYILLDERGKEFTSREFAAFLENKSAVDFVMGGPYGVSDEVREKAAGVIALSRMTFTHELARVFFLEQLYRATTIIKGKEYHH